MSFAKSLMPPTFTSLLTLTLEMFRAKPLLSISIVIFFTQKKVRFDVCLSVGC